MFKRFVARLAHFKETLLIWSSAVFGIATTVLCFFPSCKIYDNNINGFIVVAILFCVSAVAAFLQTYFGKKKVIWEKGGNKITAIYGDILDESLKKEDEIRIIPVNTAFDTIVDPPCATDKPLVSPNSLHGQWIGRQEKDYGQEALAKEIQENINGSSSREIDRSWKERGNLEEYAIGTYSAIRRGKITYLLVALASFDANNNAHSTQSDLEKALQSALAYHNRAGQGAKLMIPLMGTATSRMKLSHQESFDIIKCFLLLRKKEINGCIEIVVYRKDSDKVSIWG